MDDAAPAPAAPRTRQQAILARLDAYERLVRLDKPIGTLLLLWPTLSALWIASWGYAQLRLVLIFAMGTLLMRSAGCAFNDWADRGFDPYVQRTARRPLAAGEIPPWEALAVAAALAFCAFLFVLATNVTTILMSLPAVAIAIIYPFLKRFFVLPQAFLGLAFSFGIPMAYAAVYDLVPPLGWWLLVLNAFWVMAYDTEYAMVDRDDDLRLGLRTSAIAFGRFDVPAIMFCYVIYLGGMAYRRALLVRRPPLLRGARRGARVRDLALDADPQARPRRLLPCLPAQSLARLRGFRGHCARLRGAGGRVAADVVGVNAARSKGARGRPLLIMRYDAGQKR